MKRLQRLFFSFAAIFSFSLSNPNSYPNQEELPFVFIVASYNNKDWYKLNLDSIFSQNYSNYRVIYVDDVSPDGTGDLVEQYLAKHDLFDKTTLIKNKDRRLAMANLYMAIHMCDDDEIVFIVDGDDWLAHENVLNRVNQEYQTKDIWLTYGSYEDVFDFDKPRVRRCSDISPIVKASTLPIRKIRELIVNKGSFTPGHPKTFYAWLFKQIKLKDFLYKGLFAPTSYDNVIGFPMHQMARNHFSFIPNILYIHNAVTCLSDYKVHSSTQGTVSKFFVNSPETYFPFYAPAIKSCKESLADVLILSDHFNFSTSIHGLDKTFFITDIKLIDKLKASPNDYVLLLENNAIPETNIDICKSINLMKQTFAYTLHLKNKNLNEATKNYIRDDVYAWQFKYDRNIKPNTFDCALYRKKDVISFLKRTQTLGTKIEEIKKAWLNSPTNPEDIGLIKQ